MSASLIYSRLKARNSDNSAKVKMIIQFAWLTYMDDLYRNWLNKESGYQTARYDKASLGMHVIRFWGGVAGE